MFNTLKEWIRNLLNLINKNQVEGSSKIDIAVTTRMANEIDLWSQMFEGYAPWIDNKTVFSLGMSAAIASEFARLVTIEFKSEISNNDFLNEQYQEVIRNIRNYTEFACAKGGLVFKPYVDGDGIEVDMVQADSFFPTAFNSRGDVLGAVFLETKTMGDYIYTRLEYHNLEGKNYTIKNMAFKKNNFNNMAVNVDQSLGQQVPLTEVSDWANLEPETTINNVDRPLFAYFKMPLANTVESSSPLGVSLYSRVVDLIKKIDEQYSRIIWEYEGSELAVHADRDLMARDEDGNPIMPQGKERLYRKIDIDYSATGSKPLDVFSPAIRDTSLFNGLNNLLRYLEFEVGLAYGTLSNVSEKTPERTATEIKVNKQRTYQMVVDIQKAEQKALTDLVYAMSVWGILAGLPVKPVNLTKDIGFDWDDSIVVDKDVDLQGMFNDVAAGLIKGELYVAKKYGVSEEIAKTMMPEQTIIKPDPFASTQE